ncbi:hypothetical protein [Salinimonas chungwhensis]|uniref:hypothetical protein n=1 Tax=Salinimonas chungwhensis TaxID=265425 RepID=UPI00036E4B42|nr:hypothetical protein [Salinimonas chungwhensis]
MNHSIIAASILFVLLITVGAGGCAASTPQSALTVTMVKHTPLPDEINESSGLFCTKDGAVTVNDSGNSSTLYFLNDQGTISRLEELSLPNKDIEAITANDDFFFIGDIGNNRGQRNYVSIRQVNRQTYQKEQSYRLTYEGNNPAANFPYNHDYDAEALTIKNNKLVMFSKSWESDIAHVYEIDASPTAQVLTPVADIDGLPGIITGADWDEHNQRYVVVGYTSNLLGFLRPFLATLSETYAVTGISELEDFGQVEGVCVAASGEVWLTQEASPLQDARLIRVKLQ